MVKKDREARGFKLPLRLHLYIYISLFTWALPTVRGLGMGLWWNPRLGLWRDALSLFLALIFSCQCHGLSSAVVLVIALGDALQQQRSR